MTGNPDETTFAGAWDRYVDQARGSGQRWPGDDWGDAAVWDAWYRRLLGDFGAADWQRAVEIGQGTGKYTGRLLAGSGCRVIACDVSSRFLDLCRQRLAEHEATGRLLLRQIGERDPDGIAAAVEAEGWTGTVDAVFSIDTLVHLTFTQVAAVMLQASAVLRPDGVLAFTYACGTSEAGQRKLLADLDRVVRAGSDPSTGCFHWVSPELVRTTAESIGFEVAICDVDPCHHRDGHFVARLRDPQRAAAVRALRQHDRGRP